MIEKAILAALGLIFISGCTSKNGTALGSKERPLVMALVPGQSTQVLANYGSKLQTYLERSTGLSIKVEVPHNFIAVVESLGTQRVDFALMNTFGYLLANEKHQAHVSLMGTYKGQASYAGQIITKNPKIKTLQDLNGKKFAFVDPASTSGYILPSHLLAENKVKLKETMFAGKHDSVVILVYQGRVDAGATYHTPPEDGQPQDARFLVKEQFPDVFEKVRILTLTPPIPSDPVVFRKDFPPELELKITQALLDYEKTPDGSEVLKKLYHLSGFKRATDGDYDSVRELIRSIGKKAEDLVQK